MKIIKIYKYIESLRDEWGNDLDIGNEYPDGKEPLEITEDTDNYVFHIKSSHDRPRQVKINRELLLSAAYGSDQCRETIDDIFREAIKETAEEAEARRIENEEFRKHTKHTSSPIGTLIGATAGSLIDSPRTLEQLVIEWGKK